MRKNIIRIIDDDEELLKSTSFLLRMAGYDVLTYTSAQSFLELNDPTIPGCLLLDHRMPQMTGMELQEILNEQDVSIPIIFLSAHGDIPMAMQAVHRGAYDFLVKPVEPNILIQTIERVLKESKLKHFDHSLQKQAQENISSLSDRRLQIAQLVGLGLLNKQIAERLHISLATVKLHRGNVTKKLGVRSAVAIARVLKAAKLHLDGRIR